MVDKPRKRPFWEEKSLAQMTHDEWEALCDGCGKCCLVKLEDVDAGVYYNTRVACRLFDKTTRRCSDYPNRARRVADCLTLTLDNVQDIPWLPKTCAYRLLAQGKPLYAWHPLISGDCESIVDAGIAVAGTLLSEDDVDDDDDLLDYMIDGPD